MSAPLGAEHDWESLSNLELSFNPVGTFGATFSARGIKRIQRKRILEMQVNPQGIELLNRTGD